MPNTDPLSSTLSALADPTRRGILARLATGDATVKALAEPYDMSVAAVSKHLKVLEGAGLISRSREAQWRPCHLEAEPLQSVAAWLEDYRRFWDRSLHALAEHLETMQRRSSAKAKKKRPPSRSSHVSRKGLRR
jgi:DNA-binding transcriptional ArsR family regulator